MTVLVALKTECSVWVGADGRISHNCETITDSFVKWRQAQNGIWWASSGWSRLYTLAERNQPSGLTCLGVCEELRRAAIGDDWSSGDDKCAPVYYGINLIATDGNEIVMYHGDGSFVRFTEPGEFVAQGSGREYALGALWAMEDLEPSVLVRSSINAASQFDQGVGGNVEVFEVLPKEMGNDVV